MLPSSQMGCAARTADMPGAPGELTRCAMDVSAVRGRAAATATAGAASVDPASAPAPMLRRGTCNPGCGAGAGTCASGGGGAGAAGGGDGRLVACCWIRVLFEPVSDSRGAKLPLREIDPRAGGTGSAAAACASAVPMPSQLRCAARGRLAPAASSAAAAAAAAAPPAASSDTLRRRSRTDVGSDCSAA
eukprot:366433-Chlamydomonas_euryale.AAC.2